MDKIKQFLAAIKRWWIWLKSKFVPLYKVTVSFNNVWGDSDDQEFIVRKFIKKQPKFISFITEEGELVEISGADGLNYRIQEL